MFCDSINKLHFLGDASESLAGGLNDLDSGEWSQNLGLFFDLTNDFGDNFFELSVDVGEIEIEVDKVTEVETLVSEEFFDSCDQFIKAIVGDVMFKSAALKSSEPEKEIEDFIFIEILNVFRGLLSKSFESFSFTNFLHFFDRCASAESCNDSQS